MGQIILLPPVFPHESSGLDTAGCVFLLAVRWWVADYREDSDPMPRLCEAMRIAGADDAAYSIDQFMSVLARTVLRPISIHCPRCRSLSGDEKQLLYAAYLAQCGQGNRSREALAAALITAAGARFAFDPLQGAGELFAQAGLVFRPSRAPDTETTAETPPTGSHVRTLH